MEETQPVEVTAGQDAQIGLGVGETAAEQAAPVSTVARERMVLIIANNTKVIADCKKVLDLLNADPSLDDSFCRLFGITNNPQVRDVSR